MDLFFGVEFHGPNEEVFYSQEFGFDRPDIPVRDIASMVSSFCNLVLGKENIVSIVLIASEDKIVITIPQDIEFKTKEIIGMYVSSLFTILKVGGKNSNE